MVLQAPDGVRDVSLDLGSQGRFGEEVDVIRPRDTDEEIEAQPSGLAQEESGW